MRTFDCREWVTAVAFSPDGKVLATGLNNGMVKLWDITTGKQIGLPLKCKGRILRAAFSPDGNLLATVSREEGRTVRIWDVGSGLPYLSLTLPPIAMQANKALESFSSDGTILVRRYAGGKARIWRLPAASVGLRKMQLQTWVALGAQREEQGKVTAIPSQQWQSLRRELRAISETTEKGDEYCVPVGLEHDPKEEELLRLETLNIACRVLSGSEQPENSQFWRERGDIYVNMKEWDKAIADYSKAIELDPNNAYMLYRLALAQLGPGDSEGYRKTCATMLDQFGGTDNSTIAYWVAWTCALGADTVQDWSEPLRLAEMAAAESSDALYLHCLGKVLYRAGRFNEAVQQLSELTAEWEQGKELPTLTSPAYTWFFLAMAHHQLGHTEESHRYFELAVERAEKEMAGDVWWNRKLTLRLLRAEARSLLGVSEKVSPDGKEVIVEEEQ